MHAAPLTAAVCTSAQLPGGRGRGVAGPTLTFNHHPPFATGPCCPRAPAGTGKSSFVCALCIGLNGSPKVRRLHRVTPPHLHPTPSPPVGQGRALPGGQRPGGGGSGRGGQPSAAYHLALPGAGGGRRISRARTAVASPTTRCGAVATSAARSIAAPPPPPPRAAHRPVLARRRGTPKRGSSYSCASSCRNAQSHCDHHHHHLQRGHPPPPRPCGRPLAARRWGEPTT